MEPFLKEQPDNYSLLGDLALINMSLGDKATALALSKPAIAAKSGREGRRDWSLSN